MIVYLGIAAAGLLIAFALAALVCLSAGERQLLRFCMAMIAAANLILFVVACANIFKAVHP